MGRGVDCKAGNLCLRGDFLFRDTSGNIAKTGEEKKIARIGAIRARGISLERGASLACVIFDGKVDKRERGGKKREV